MSFFFLPYTEVCGFFFSIVGNGLRVVPIHRGKKREWHGAVPYDVNLKLYHFAGRLRSFRRVLRNGHNRSLHYLDSKPPQRAASLINELCVLCPIWQR